MALSAGSLAACGVNDSIAVHTFPEVKLARLLLRAQLATTLLAVRRVVIMAPSVRRSARSVTATAAKPKQAPQPTKRGSKRPAQQDASEPAANKKPVRKEAAINKKATPQSDAHASRAREEAAWAAGIQLVCGCDEAGRGPLAGPVVAAACMLPASAPPIAGVGDSKTITDEAAREALYEQIVATPGVVWSARVVSAQRIDEINILMASLEAMRLSVVDVLGAQSEAGAKKQTGAQKKNKGAKTGKAAVKALALIDGPFSPWKEGEKYAAFQQPAPPPGVSLAVEPVIKGDSKVYCIAAASILAKARAAPPPFVD